MARIKELGYFLASCIYEHGICEGEIVEITSFLLEDEDGLDYSIWLRRQIQYVKRNPDVFGHSPKENQPSSRTVQTHRV